MTSAAAGAFDATSYRQRVMSVLRTAQRLDLSDPFFIVDLPVDTDDDELIRARIVTLVGLWNKERSPNYKALAAELASHRADLEAVLLNPARRAAAAAEVRQQRAAAEADRYEALDSLAGKLVERYQGLPSSRLAGLAKLAASRGIDADAFAAWAARYPVIRDGTDAEPLTPSLRAQIRAELDEFGRLTGDPERSATLWSFLGLAPAAAQPDVAARLTELARQNELRQHDHQMTVTANLLTYARQYLASGEQARYAASLAQEAKDRLHDWIAEKVIVDGELSAADYEGAVLKVLRLGFGLTTEQARSAVRQVATGLGATLAVAPAVDYLLCPECREPQPAGGNATCRYCGADLFLTCPSCAQRAEAAARACPRCGASFESVKATRAALAAARELPGSQQEAALRRILDADPGNTQALNLLAALPLEPPGNLRSQVAPDAIALRWDSPAGPAAMTFKVVRVSSAPSGGQSETRVLGTTPYTEFEDAGAPGGAMVAHEVTAVAGHRTSAPARTAPALLARDVTNLRARAGPDGIILTWSLPIRFGKVVVEREASQDAPIRVMPRRDVVTGESWLDARPTPGIDFVYHVFAEYTDPRGNPVRTPGAIVRATALPGR